MRQEREWLGMAEKLYRRREREWGECKRYDSVKSTFVKV